MDNIAQGFYLFSVGSWLTDNIYEENNLYNVVLTILGQHCIGRLSSQYCLNTSKTILHKKITCAMLAQSGQITFAGKPAFSICLVACFLTATYIITEQSWLLLFNVGLAEEFI